MVLLHRDSKKLLTQQDILGIITSVHLTQYDY